MRGDPVNLAQWRDLLMPGVYQLASDEWLNPERRSVSLEVDGNTLVMSSWHDRLKPIRSVITEAEIQRATDGSGSPRDMVKRHLAIVAPQYQFADEAVVAYE